jgi:hypothetical protein
VGFLERKASGSGLEARKEYLFLSSLASELTLRWATAVEAVLAMLDLTIDKMSSSHDSQVALKGVI